MRIAPTSPDNTEILCELGLQSQLVGVSRHCDFPQDLQASVPVISDFGKVDVDKIRMVKPDVVFCSTYYQAEIVKTLVDNHLRVFVTQPETLASIYDNIRWVGQLVGQSTRADVVVQAMQEAMPQQPSTGLKVFCEEWGDPLVLAAPWIHEMIALAGGISVMPELLAFTHTRDRIILPESVVQTAADIVLLPWCGCHGKIPLEKVKTRPGWTALPAVQNDRLYPLEDSFFVRPGPRLVEGYRQLQKIFAEGLAADEEMAVKA